MSMLTLHLQLEIWSQLAVILQRSLLNVQACTDKDLLSHCLSHLLLTSDDAVAGMYLK